MATFVHGQYIDQNQKRDADRRSDPGGFGMLIQQLNQLRQEKKVADENAARRAERRYETEQYLQLQRETQRQTGDRFDRDLQARKDAEANYLKAAAPDSTKDRERAMFGYNSLQQRLNSMTHDLGVYKQNRDRLLSDLSGLSQSNPQYRDKKSAYDQASKLADDTLREIHRTVDAFNNQYALGIVVESDRGGNLRFSEPFIPGGIQRPAPTQRPLETPSQLQIRPSASALGGPGIPMALTQQNFEAPTTPINPNLRFNTQAAMPPGAYLPQAPDMSAVQPIRQFAPQDYMITTDAPPAAPFPYPTASSDAGGRWLYTDEEPATPRSFF